MFAPAHAELLEVLAVKRGKLFRRMYAERLVFQPLRLRQERQLRKRSTGHFLRFVVLEGLVEFREPHGVGDRFAIASLWVGIPFPDLMRRENLLGVLVAGMGNLDTFHFIEDRATGFLRFDRVG